MKIGEKSPDIWSSSVAKTLFAARFKWLSALPLLVVIGLLTIIALVTLSNAQTNGGGARADVFDFFQRVSPAEATSTDQFHVIHIDAESIERVGPWPWPRSLIADLVSESTEAGAKAVVYTEPVDAKDPLSPETIGDFWLSGARDDALARQLALLPGTDLMLARSLAKTKGVISAAPFATDNRLARADTNNSTTFVFADASSASIGLPAASIRIPIKDDLNSAATLSVAALPMDSDGIFRSLPLLWAIDGIPVPSIALEAARAANSTNEIQLTISDTNVSSSGKTITGLTLGDHHFPLTEKSAVRFYPSQKIDVTTTSAWRILQTNTPLPHFNGKVILIGLDKDISTPVRTPRGEFSRVELHTLMAGQLASGVVASRPPWIGYFEALSVMLLGAAAIMWSQRLDFWKAVGIAAFASLIIFATAYGTFSFSATLIDPIPAITALFLGAFSVAGGRSLGVVLKDDSVRGSFQGALPEPAMKKLREDNSSTLLEGIHRDITVLACELSLLDADSRRQVGQPDEMTNIIAAACQSLKKAIIETGGAVDQADGGKIFGYFNAPLESADHVRSGCSSALRLVESLDKINTELDASSRLHGVQIHLAIGIATGPCLIGPMGQNRSNRYSAIGPAVEMAAFLRRQAEKYGPAIICDEPVYRQTHHHFAFLELDQLTTESHERAFAIHALVGNPFIKSSKSYRTLEDAHRKMLSAYRDGDFENALTFLAEAKKSPGARIALFDLYEDRIKKQRSSYNESLEWDPTEKVLL